MHHQSSEFVTIEVQGIPRLAILELSYDIKVVLLEYLEELYLEYRVSKPRDRWRPIVYKLALYPRGLRLAFQDATLSHDEQRFSEIVAERYESPLEKIKALMCESNHLLLIFDLQEFVGLISYIQNYRVQINRLLSGFRMIEARQNDLDIALYRLQKAIATELSH